MKLEDLQAMKLISETPSLCEYVISCAKLLEGRKEKKKLKGMLIKSSFFLLLLRPRYGATAPGEPGR